MHHEHGYTAYVRYAFEDWVAPDGSGRYRGYPLAPSFPTAADRAAWVKAGSPKFPTVAPEHGRRPASEHAFPPREGSTALSYAQVRALSPDPAKLEAQLRALLPGTASPAGNTGVLDRAGALLAAAPLTPAQRSALFHVAAGLPGVRISTDALDRFGQRGTAVPPGRDRERVRFRADDAGRPRFRQRARGCARSSPTVPATRSVTTPRRSPPTSPRPRLGGVPLVRDFPLFPLGLVALPSELVPLHIFEERYKTMIARCLEEESQVRDRLALRRRSARDRLRLHRRRGTRAPARRARQPRRARHPPVPDRGAPGRARLPRRRDRVPRRPRRGARPRGRHRPPATPIPTSSSRPPTSTRTRDRSTR